MFALLAMRRFLAAIIGLAVLALGTIPEFWNGTTAGWAVLLALVPFAGRVLGPAG